jgi:hypothetical protein
MDDKKFEFLKINEAAALLGIPVATLRWWRSKGKGPAASSSVAASSTRCENYAGESKRNGTAALSSCKTMSCTERVHFLWSEEDAQYIKTRSRRYPGALEIEPDRTQEVPGG